MTDRSDPISVAQRFGGRDPSATREVLERVRRILAFRRYGIPEEDRRELEQVVMIQIWEGVRLPGFDPTGFWGFVEVVTSRRCIDWLRLRRTEISLEDSDDLADSSRGPLRTLLDREKSELAREVLAQLPEPCRRVVEIVIGQGRTYAEAASILGTSEGALRVRMYRCIRDARKLLGDRL